MAKLQKEKKRNTHLHVKEASWNIASLLSYLRNINCCKIDWKDTKHTLKHYYILKNSKYALKITNCKLSNLRKNCENQSKQGKSNMKCHAKFCMSNHAIRMALWLWLWTASRSVRDSNTSLSKTFLSLLHSLMAI